MLMLYIYQWWDQMAHFTHIDAQYKVDLAFHIGIYTSQYIFLKNWLIPPPKNN